ncbi:MAG: uroporphyrinogen decarboxylase family protein [Anaerolineae bacterium]
MNHRERILAAIHHQPVDRLPTDIWATPEVWQKLRVYFNVDDNLEVYDKLDIDGMMGISPTYIGPKRPTIDGISYDEWGMGYRSQGYGSGSYNEQVVFPLASVQTVADLEAFTWPSPDWYDYASLPAQAVHYAGRSVQVGYTAIFYWHNRLRGLQQSLMDPLEQPEMTRYLVLRLSDFFNEYHTRCFEATRGLVDSTQVTDDFGSQTGLMISPGVFDQFYRQGMQRAIDLAHQYGLIVFHHDDGDLRKLLPRLVEMGIDLLNPIQWRCGNWDLARLKAEYGGKLCFHSAVDNQQTLPFGTPRDVREEVRYLIHTLGSDRTGFIIAPCHCLQPVTPMENILALYETANRGFTD